MNKYMDFSQMFNSSFFKDMKLGNLGNNNDMMNKIKQNNELFFCAGQMALESGQVLAKKAVDNLQKNTTDFFSAVKDTVTSSNLENTNTSNQHYIKSTIDSNLSNMKEMFEIATRSSKDVMELVMQGLNENLSKSMGSSQKEESVKCNNKAK